MGYKLTAFQRAYILQSFYGKESLRRIAFNFRENFHLPISAATILRRAVEDTLMVNDAIDYLMRDGNPLPLVKESDFVLRLGDIWEIDEIWLPLGKENFPVIAVKDLKTCFFPAAPIEKTSSIETTANTLIYARKLAHKCPVELRCDGNAVYDKAKKIALGNKTKLTINKKTTKAGKNQSIEGTFGGTIRSWIKSKRSLHSWLISPIIIKGYFLDYHFAKPCEALCGIPPAEIAIAWNPLDGVRGWPALLQLAEYYSKTIVTSKKQKQVSKRIQMQITLDGLQLKDSNWTRKDDSLSGISNKKCNWVHF
jgi:hypothetical protein